MSDQPDTDPPTNADTVDGSSPPWVGSDIDLSDIAGDNITVDGVNDEIDGTAAGVTDHSNLNNVQSGQHHSKTTSPTYVDTGSVTLNDGESYISKSSSDGKESYRVSARRDSNTGITGFAGATTYNGGVVINSSNTLLETIGFSSDSGIDGWTWDFEILGWN